jgi:hypothetical protein
MSANRVLPRGQRESYIQSLTLSNNQKRGFINSGLNRNTIQKVVNAVKGTTERNTRINGILNALSQRPSNRGPLNNLLRQYNNRLRTRASPQPRTTPNNRSNTTPNNTRQRANATPSATPNNRSNTTPNNTRQRTNATPTTSVRRSSREGAGLSEKTLMSVPELYEFFQLMKEFEEKRGNVTTPNASPMPILNKMLAYKQKMCKLASYTYTGNIRLIRDVVDNVRSLCSDEGGDYTTYPIINQPNANKTNELMKMCLTSSFEELLSTTPNKNGRRNANILSKIYTIYDRFLSLLKNVDAEVALRLYVKNGNSQNLNTYISKQSNKVKRSLTQNVSNDYRLLINKIIKKVGNQKHNPIPVAVAHGPANHNTLSVSSMRKILQNPDIIKNFNEGSLFLKYLNAHIPDSGTGGCKMRGDVDGCLLRRRVVFAQPHATSSAGEKAIQTALSAINHGRMHRLKTFSNNGNRRNRVGQPKKNFTTFDILKKYMNSMKNKSVRNIPLFTSPTNKLLELQQGGERVAVKFDGSKLVKFESKDTENPHILWTTFGLHLEERGKQYEFVDFINFIYDRDNRKVNENVKNIKSYKRERGKMGMNYIIQLDSKTLTYLHQKYFFEDMTNETYKDKIITKLTACSPR